MKPIAKVLIFDADNNLLVLRRSLTHPHWPHGIDFPGGDTEPSERVEEASIREVFEETGLYVEEKDLKEVFQRVKNARQQLVFAVSLDALKPSVTLSWEHDKYFWVKPADLPEYKNKVDDSFYEAALIALSKS